MDIRSGKVLIVDDDPAIQQLLLKKLASDAYYCVVASDGEQAVEEARRHSFGVVLLDIRLPGISGLEALQYLCSIQPDACVVMVSGNDEQPVAVEAMKMGAYDYIQKPFDLEDLALRVRKATQRHRILVEKREREKSLEEQIQQQETEIRGLVGQTVQTLVREHMLERQFSGKKTSRRRKIEPAEVSQLAQAVQALIHPYYNGEKRPEDAKEDG